MTNVSGLRHLVCILELLTEREKKRSLNVEADQIVLRPAQLGIMLRAAAARSSMLLGPNPLVGLMVEVTDIHLLLGVPRSTNAHDWLSMCRFVCEADTNLYQPAGEMLIAKVSHQEVRQEINRIFGQTVAYGPGPMKLLFASALNRNESTTTRDRVRGKRKN